MTVFVTTRETSKNEVEINTLYRYIKDKEPTSEFIDDAHFEKDIDDIKEETYLFNESALNKLIKFKKVIPIYQKDGSITARIDFE